MSVLELSAQSRMLREAAKGWSAGSVPLEDYRMIRRATLASMLGVDPDEEDTAAGLIAAVPDVTENVDHGTSSARAAGQGRMIIVIAAAAIVVVGSAIALLFAE